MPLSAGTKFGPYEILAAIGAGGMGEVYRARDTRLNRDVALKVLPSEFANDPARRHLFEKEARAVAALNHPNIVAIYDVGENFLVSELVQGQTLRQADKLAHRQVIDLAVQICEGLAAAHAAGITHRDLKPHNIMIARDGRAKILDFGLAKLTPPQAPGAPPPEASTQTAEGMIMGTIGYMSPEQVRGQSTDHRSDIFSFGLVLYEMLSGGQAFSGGSAVEVMSAILKEDPPELPASIGRELKRIVARCLDKHPDRRFQSALDLAFALQAPTSQESTASPVPRSRSRKWILGAAFAVTIAASILAARLLWPAPVETSWSGVMLGGSEMALNPRLSPDGHFIAFAAMVDSLTQVAVMKPESGNWSVLTRDRTRGQVFDISWSPDGSLIYYHRANGVTRGIYSVPVLGGDEHLVLADAGSPEVLPDGSLIITKVDANRKRKIHRFWPGTGRIEELAIQPARSLSQNTSSRAHPDGKTILIWGQPVASDASAVALYSFDLASGSLRRITPPRLNAADVTAYVASADGKSALVAVNAGTLTRITSFPMSGSGSERPLFTVTSTVWYLDSGPDGSVYLSMLDRPSDLAKFSVDGSHYEKLATFPLVPEDADIMTILPDGRAAVAVRASGQNRLMIVQQGKDPAPLVNTTEETMAPLSTCGPLEVAFMLGPEPHETIAYTEPASGRIVRKIAPGKGPIESLSCSPDGKLTFFAARGVIWSVPSPGGDARSLRAGDRVIADPSGRRLIVQVRESSELRLFSVPLDGAPESEIRLDRSVRLSGSPLSSSGLSADGRLLVPLSPRDSWFNPPAVIDTATGRITRIPSDNQSDHRTMGWTADGQIIALKNGLRASLWKFQPAGR